MTDFDDKVNEIFEPSKIFLSIKADDNEKNQAIHNGFRAMAAFEFPQTHDNYTLTLGKLLEYYQSEAKIEMLWNEIQVLTERIVALESNNNAPSVKLPSAF